MKKKIALVTGAGSGLGEQLVYALHAQGCFVVLVGRDQTKLDRVGKRLQDNFLTVAADISLKANVDTVFKKALAVDGVLSTVIHAAGEGVFAKVGAFDDHDLEKVFAANLFGTILISQGALNAFGDRGGTLVNVMSTAANVAKAGEAIYCAAKWGAKGFTESLRLETKGSRVRILSVYPGGMDTPFWDAPSDIIFDTSTLMDPKEVAEVILANLQDKSTLQVTELTINRL